MTKPVRVLIADDHHMVREGLRLFLSESPETVEVVGEAVDGEEVLRLAEQLQPDVILMDIAMPRLDGLAATRRLAERGIASRVLILTSSTDDSHVRDAVKAGATGYLMKDIRREELLGAIRAAAAGVPTLHPRAQEQLMRHLARPEPESPLAALTPRERDVLRLIAAGRSNKQIAAMLHLSLGTVKGYVSEVLEKLGVDDRTQAALLAVKHQLD